MALTAPTIESCGKNKDINWLILVLPDISKSKSENGKTYQLQKAFVVRAKVRHRKQTGQPMEPVSIGHHVIARYKKTTVPKVGTLLLDSRQTNLRDGAYIYSVVARYTNQADPDELNIDISPPSDIVAF